MSTPRISIVVITYNSSKYVLETLESVKSQDYSNLELIVSDDCSTDETFEVCKKWVSDNATRFCRAVVVQTEKNGGICVNYNRGLREVTGKWVKYIAGDDILLANCISTFASTLKYCSDKIMICGILRFSDSTTIEEPRILPSYFDNLSVNEQEKFLVRSGTVVPGPTLFLETETLRNLGGFEECYPFIEDYPLCMKYLSKGYHIHLANYFLIRYRVYQESVSRGDSRFSVSISNAIDFYAPKAAWRNGLYLWWYHYRINTIIRNLPNSKKWIGYILRFVDIINYCIKFDITLPKVFRY